MDFAGLNILYKKTVEHDLDIKDDQDDEWDNKDDQDDNWDYDIPNVVELNHCTCLGLVTTWSKWTGIGNPFPSKSLIMIIIKVP